MLFAATKKEVKIITAEPVIDRAGAYILLSSGVRLSSEQSSQCVKELCAVAHAAILLGKNDEARKTLDQAKQLLFAGIGLDQMIKAANAPSKKKGNKRKP